MHARLLLLLFIASSGTNAENHFAAPLDGAGTVRPLWGPGGLLHEVIGTGLEIGSLAGVQAERTRRSRSSRRHDPSICYGGNQKDKEQAIHRHHRLLDLAKEWHESE